VVIDSRAMLSGIWFTIVDCRAVIPSLNRLGSVAIVVPPVVFQPRADAIQRPRCLPTSLRRPFSQLSRCPLYPSRASSPTTLASWPIGGEGLNARSTLYISGYRCGTHKHAQLNCLIHCVSAAFPCPAVLHLFSFCERITLLCSAGVQCHPLS
jgi:hypothetical protein